eukprot:4492454-Heterocapsa_arctica.AAC.1
MEDFRHNQTKICKNYASCLMCNCFKDVKELEDYYREEHFSGMKEYIKAMRNNDEWKTADTRTRLFMVCAQLAGGTMTKEKKAISWYGG